MSLLILTLDRPAELRSGLFQNTVSARYIRFRFPSPSFFSSTRQAEGLAQRPSSQRRPRWPPQYLLTSLPKNRAPPLGERKPTRRFEGLNHQPSTQRREKPHSTRSVVRCGVGNRRKIGGRVPRPRRRHPRASIHVAFLPTTYLHG